MGKKKSPFNYNTGRESLKLPEYGRHIQTMVDHLKTIEDRETRNKAAQTLIAIMQNTLAPKDINGDVKHKLWDHLAIMADFDLDVDAPFELPTHEKMAIKPRKIPYSSQKISFKHYGHLTEELIANACELPEGDEKNVVVWLIANHMKRQYLSWNRQQVSDETIYKDLITMSGGKITIPPDMPLQENKALLGSKRKKKPFKKK